MGRLIAAALLCAWLAWALAVRQDYGTFLGGSGTDGAQGCAADSAGNFYVVGQTTSTNFPASSGAYDTSHNGSDDAYVCKFDNTGARVWCTYVGGANSELAISVVPVSDGVIVGGTAASGFPTTGGVLQTAHAGGTDREGVVFKLNSAGSSLVWSTYFGNDDSAGDGIREIAVDPSGNIYLIASHATGAWNTAINNCFLNSPMAGEDTVVARINSTGTACAWARYVGGSGEDTYVGALSWHSSGLYAVAPTTSSGIATGGAYDTTYGGSGDYMVFRINHGTGALDWLSYLGSAGIEGASKRQITTDEAGNVYVLGITDSSGFPTTGGAYDTSHNGGDDLTVSKLNSAGTSLLAGTFVGTAVDESAETIRIDPAGRVWVTGTTTSSSWPTAFPFQSSLRGTEDGIVFALSNDLTTLQYSSYVGGTGGAGDSARCLAFLSTKIHLLAQTANSGGWDTLAAFQSSYGGGSVDAFLFQFFVPPSSRITGRATGGGRFSGR